MRQLALAWCMLMLPLQLGTPNMVPDPADRTERFVKLLNQLYPQAPVGHIRRLHLSTEVVSSTWRLSGYQWRLTEENSRTPEVEILSGYFGFNLDGSHPTVTTFMGTLANTEMLKQLRDRSRRKPSAPLFTLSERPMTYGPGERKKVEALMAQLQPAIEEYLGRQIGLPEIDFDRRRPEVQEHHGLTWEVKYFPLTIEIEPFDGRVIMINNY